MTQSSIGHRLREARESMPASLAEASRATRVRVDFLEAMERDSFTFLSGRVYVRGMLRSYATWLRLDPNEISADFDKSFADAEGPSLSRGLTTGGERSGLSVKPRKPQWAVVGSVALVVLVVLLAISFLRGPGKVAPPAGLGATSTPSSSLVSPSAVATPSSATTPSSSPAPGPGAGGPTSPPGPQGGVKVEISVTRGQSWVHVILGQTVPSIVTFQGILLTGVSRTFSASDVLRIDIGNLGAVDVKVNDKDLGAPGAPGVNGAFLINQSGSLTPDDTAVVLQPSNAKVITN